jgi:hypothetical protein
VRGHIWAAANTGEHPTQLRTVWPEWGATADGVAALKKSRSAGLVSDQLMKRFKWKDQVTVHAVAPVADLTFNWESSFSGWEFSRRRDGTSVATAQY